MIPFKLFELFGHSIFLIRFTVYILQTIRLLYHIINHIRHLSRATLTPHRPILAVSNIDRSIFPCIGRSEKSMAKCVLNSGQYCRANTSGYLSFSLRIDYAYAQRTCALQSRIARSVTMERRSYARSLYCDVIITPKAHCLQCIENFVKHWMHSAGARKPCAM